MQETAIVTAARKLLGNLGIACSTLDEGSVHCVGVANGKYASVSVTGPESEETAEQLATRAASLRDDVVDAFEAIH